MNPNLISSLTLDLLVILTAGFLSGVLCKRLSLSIIAGYFIAGIFIGQGGFDLVSQNEHELETLAEAGALLLLFSVGIEFSLSELTRSLKHCFVGGIGQMVMVSIPLAFFLNYIGLDRNLSIFLALAASLSSTVLVFKALSEWGQTATAHGRRGISILIFQDISLIPLMLMIPLLLQEGSVFDLGIIFMLLGKTAIFISAVLISRKIIVLWIVPHLDTLQSVELVVLFTISLLLGSCCAAHYLGLPPAIGALSTGLMLSGNILSKQIDTIILPFREIFASIFFVSLGSLLIPRVFIEAPLLITAGILGIILLKFSASTLSLRLTGLGWRSSAGMGLGLAQLGEFSFLLMATAMSTGALSSKNYDHMLFIALGTLIITPQLIELGLRFIGVLPDKKLKDDRKGLEIKKAFIVGAGPFGRQAASRLDTLGYSVCLIDLSPINLHEFSVHGFSTIAGDAREAEVLHRANIEDCHSAIVCVTKDEISNQIISNIRQLNKSISILAHCRYQKNAQKAKLAGADIVVTEEGEAFKNMNQFFSDTIN